VEALLKADRITNDINPGEKGKPGYNPEMTVAWALRYATHATLAYREAKALRGEVAALATKIDEIAAKVGHLLDRPPAQVDAKAVAGEMIEQAAELIRQLRGATS